MSTIMNESVTSETATSEMALNLSFEMDGGLFFQDFMGGMVLQYRDGVRIHKDRLDATKVVPFITLTRFQAIEQEIGSLRLYFLENYLLSALKMPLVGDFVMKKVIEYLSIGDIRFFIKFGISQLKSGRDIFPDNFMQILSSRDSKYKTRIVDTMMHLVTEMTKGISAFKAQCIYENIHPDYRGYLFNSHRAQLLSVLHVNARMMNRFVEAKTYEDFNLELAKLKQLRQAVDSSNEKNKRKEFCAMMLSNITEYFALPVFDFGGVCQISLGEDDALLGCAFDGIPRMSNRKKQLIRFFQSHKILSSQDEFTSYDRKINAAKTRFAQELKSLEMSSQEKKVNEDNKETTQREVKVESWTDRADISREALKARHEAGLAKQREQAEARKKLELEKKKKEEQTKKALKKTTVQKETKKSKGKR